MNRNFVNAHIYVSLHESNKILWEIKQNLKDKNFKKNLTKKSNYLKKIISHSEFI